MHLDIYPKLMGIEGEAMNTSHRRESFDETLEEKNHPENG